MEISNIPEEFQSKLRLTILSILMKESECSFTELRRIAGATDGNLSVQLSKLEAAGFIAVRKELVGKKTLTTCRVTDEGRRSFVEYVELLRTIVEGQ